MASTDGREPGSGVPPLRLSRGALVTILLLVVALSFSGIFSHSLWSPDEPSGAAIGRNMLDHDDWIVTEIGGWTYLEKPPLFWWVQVTGFTLFGPSDWAARLPSALFALLTLAVTAGIGWRLGGRSVALLSVLVLATTVGFAEETSRATVDTVLTCFVALAHLGFVLLLQSTRAQEKWRAALIVALAVPLAFLAKGFVGPALALGPPVAYLLVSERRRSFGKLAALVALGVPLFALVVAPWLAELGQRAGASGLREMLVNNTLGRIAGAGDNAGYGHRHGLLYYLGQAPLVLMPWTLALPAVLRRRNSSPSPGVTTRGLLVAIGAVGLFGLSLATTKRASYLLPLLPATAVLVAAWIAELAGRELPALDRRTLRTLATISAALPLATAGCFVVLYAVPLRSPLQIVIRQASSPAISLLAASLGVALGGVALLRLGRRKPAATTPWLAGLFVPLAGALLLYQTAIKSTIDPIKNLHQSTAAVARWIPGRDRIPVFVPKGEQAERLVAILDFDLDRSIERMTDAAELTAWMEGHPGSRVLTAADSLPLLAPATLGRLAPVYDERNRTTAQYVILEVKPASAKP